MVRALRRLHTLARRFRREQTGVSAVEFALILPVMLLLFFGTVEVGNGVAIKRKVTHLTSTLADLVTQAKTLSATDVDNIFDIGKSIIVPYDSSKLKIIVSGVSIDANKVAKVTWSRALNDTAEGTGSVYDIPTELKIANTFLAVAEVHYTYTPTIGYMITGSFNIGDRFFLRPRLSATVGYQP